MKFKPIHAHYIGNKIALDLSACGFVSVLQGLEGIAKVAEDFIAKNIQEEAQIEEKARDILEDNLEEIEFMQADEHQLFWRIKQKVAENENFILNFEDRYNHLSHAILNALFEEDLIDSDTSETRIVNVIFKAINGYSKIYNAIEEVVQERIANYKRKIIYGSEEYDLIFNQLYKEELKKKGFL